MPAIDRIYRTLRVLGLYRLGTGSLVDGELAAYAAAFSILEELLEEVERQAFVQTATGQGLLRHEKLVGLQEREGVGLSTRRDLVLYRLAVAPHDFTLDRMARSVGASGLDAEIKEHRPEEKITVTSAVLLDRVDDLDSIRQRLESMLPAHLEWELEVGALTWDMFDDTLVCWDRWDSLDFTWDLFELDGYNILKGE